MHLTYRHELMKQTPPAPVTGYTMGGFVHILPVIAIVVVVVLLIQGRRVL